MNHRRPIAMLMLVAVLVPLLATACGSSTTTTTLRFDVVPTERQLVDNGAAGASMGDALASNGDLRNSDGETIGRYSLHGFNTQVMPGREERFLNMEYAFDAEDAIEAQGSNDYPLNTSTGSSTADGHADDTIVLAIIGGTGRYDTARGSCTLNFEAPVYHATCTVKQ